MKNIKVKYLLIILIYSFIGLNAISSQDRCTNLFKTKISNNSFFNINLQNKTVFKPIIISTNIHNMNMMIEQSYIRSALTLAIKFLDEFQFSDKINILFSSFRNGYNSTFKTINLKSSPQLRDPSNENSNTFSQSTFLHEFAHNVFDITITQILKNKFPIDNFLKELDNIIFPTFFTPKYTNEVNERHSKLQNEIYLISNSYYGNKYLLWNIIYGRELSAFNELFADTLVILVENDLTAMSKSLIESNETLYSNNDINCRNFDNIQLINVDNSKVKLNEYNYFSDVRLWIGSYLKNNPKNRIKNGNSILKEILNFAIEISTDKNYKLDYLTNEDEKIILNVKLINRLKQVTFEYN